jgi:hypothetical protein
MKFSIATALSLATLSLAVGLGGCSTETSESAPEASSKPVVTDRTEHALSVVASSSHPVVADGRVVDAWQTFLMVDGTFGVRGTTASGDTIAEFTFKPETNSGSLVIESLLPERATLRIVDGAVVEKLAVSAETEALYEAMGNDLEAFATNANGSEGGLATQGWWACTKATAKVTYHCGGSAVKIVLCLRKAKTSGGAILACISDVGDSCSTAAKNFVKECL